MQVLLLVGSSEIFNMIRIKVIPNIFHVRIEDLIKKRLYLSVPCSSVESLPSPSKELSNGVHVNRSRLS